MINFLGASLYLPASKIHQFYCMDNKGSIRKSSSITPHTRLSLGVFLHLGIINSPSILKMPASPLRIGTHSINCGYNSCRNGIAAIIGFIRHRVFSVVGCWLTYLLDKSPSTVTGKGSGGNAALKLIKDVAFWPQAMYFASKARIFNRDLTYVTYRLNGVHSAGFEPATTALLGTRSIQLSYECIKGSGTALPFPVALCANSSLYLKIFRSQSSFTEAAV